MLNYDYGFFYDNARKAQPTNGFSSRNAWKLYEAIMNDGALLEQALYHIENELVFNNAVTRFLEDLQKAESNVPKSIFITRKAVKEVLKRIGD
jgi:hypothetical protein